MESTGLTKCLHAITYLVSVIGGGRLCFFTSLILQLLTVFSFLENTVLVVMIRDFREALVRQICGLDYYGDPPASENIQPVQDYETVHMPEVSDAVRRNCVVCYAAGIGHGKVSTYCTAPQCGKFMHVGADLNCFKEWHAKDMVVRGDEQLLVLFAVVTYWTKVQHQFMPS